MKKNNTYPQLREDQRDELFKENQDFLNKYVNYEINNLQKIEDVYKGINDNPKLKKYINNNSFSVLVPLFSTICILIPLFLFIQSFFWSGVITSVILAIILLITWGIYLDDGNKRGAILVNAYNDLKDNEIIEESELISLKCLLSESEMVDLLRCYNKEIPVSKVVDLLEHYRWDFRNWEATQLYHEI